MLGFLRSFVSGKIRVGNDETVLVVRRVIFVFDAIVDHLRSPEEEGLIHILRETLIVSYSRWIHEARESIRTSDLNGGEKVRGRLKDLRWCCCSKRFGSCVLRLGLFS